MLGKLIPHLVQKFGFPNCVANVSNVTLEFSRPNKSSPPWVFPEPFSWKTIVSLVPKMGNLKSSLVEIPKELS